MHYVTILTIEVSNVIGLNRLDLVWQKHLSLTVNNATDFGRIFIKLIIENVWRVREQTPIYQG